MIEDNRLNRPSRFWRIAAVLFLVVNAGGAVFAYIQGEQMHAEMHLALFGAAFVGYAFTRAAQARSQDPPPAELEDPRIEQLQRSIDAMALELERMGEKQRYAEKLKAGHKDPPGEH
ncbi:MAG: hypothetical protein M3Z17_01650 [Gemmatimonadota bacterium]|nr:hypothetical protein [Gemmatimonadota bacterium]